jgi:hypothetical protein
MSHLHTRDDFQTAYKQFFRLVGQLPPDLEQLRPLCASLDEYAARYPDCSWPLAVIAADGNRTPLNNPDELLRLLSATPAPLEATKEARSVKILESDWLDIRKILVQLPKDEGMPTNIIGYLHTAHKHYEAHLRKQGKLVY